MAAGETIPINRVEIRSASRVDARGEQSSVRNFISQPAESRRSNGMEVRRHDLCRFRHVALRVLCAVGIDGLAVDAEEATIRNQ